MKEALIGARGFYFLFHAAITGIFLYYDNLFKEQVMSLQLFYPLVLFCIIGIGTYFFMTVGKRPGYIGMDQSRNAELIRETDEYYVYSMLGDMEFRLEKNVPASARRRDYSQEEPLKKEGEIFKQNLGETPIKTERSDEELNKKVVDTDTSLDNLDIR